MPKLDKPIAPDVFNFPDESIHNFILYAVQNFRDEDGCVDIEQFEIEFIQYLRCLDVATSVLRSRNASTQKLCDRINKCDSLPE